MPRARRNRLGDHRCLVLCFDGTGDKFDGDNTNILKFFSLLRKDEEEQMVYYQPGLGTYVSPGIWGGISSTIAKAADMAVAWYLEAHVMHGYNFLMNNYRPGKDHICLFGFSRGAYTARCLAGMLHKVGLLPKNNLEQVTFAFEMYKRTDEEGIERSRAFKAAFSRTVDIEFMGVWDTVDSVGALIPRHLPFTSSNSIIKTFRHAVSLDERRSKFGVNLWHWAPEKHDDHIQDSEQILHDDQVYRPQRKDSTTYGSKTDVLEVWFAGGHADVGGGEDKDQRVHSLSNISLRWMCQEVSRSQCGILFDKKKLKALGIPQTVFHISRAFDDFKATDENETLLIRERESVVKFTEEPEEFKDEDTTTTLISSPLANSPTVEMKPLNFEDRRWSMPSGNIEKGVAKTTARAPPIPAYSVSLLRRLSTPLVGPAVVNLPEPNEHTCADHYRMTCVDLDEEEALETLHDQLTLQPLWWLLECLPFKRAWQEHGVWYQSYMPNFFRGRRIPEDPIPNIHHSVLIRCAKKGYSPKAKLPENYIVIK